MASITQLINQKVESKSLFVSFEFFPPKTNEGVETLFRNIEILKKYDPLFVDFTWGAGGSTSDLTIDLCRKAIDLGLVTNMHLTCTGLDLNHIDKVLETCVESKITNILALRGDPPQGQTNWVPPENGLTDALQLIQHITNNVKHPLSLSAAGYPEGHPDKMTVVLESEIESLSESERNRLTTIEDPVTQTKEYLVCKDTDFANEIKYLKEKVDAGASFIITQMFFDVNVYVSFVRECRQAGILVPIVPGIMILGTYGGFKRMCKMCKTRVPVEVGEEVEKLKENDEGLKQYGVRFCVQMLARLAEEGAPGLHFYTLNSATQVVKILEELSNVLPLLNLN